MSSACVHYFYIYSKSVIYISSLFRKGLLFVMEFFRTPSLQRFQKTLLYRQTMIFLEIDHKFLKSRVILIKEKQKLYVSYVMTSFVNKIILKNCYFVLHSLYIYIYICFPSMTILENKNIQEQDTCRYKLSNKEKGKLHVGMQERFFSFLLGKH